MSKKKKEKIGVIKGIDLIRKSKPINDIPFRECGYLSEKDRHGGMIDDIGMVMV